MASDEFLSRSAQQCIDDYAPEQHVGAVHHQPTASDMSVWRVGMWPHRDTLSARLVQCSKRQIDGGKHGDKTETDAYFEDGYYDSAKTLVRALNDELKGGRVKFAYEPVTQKVTAYMKGDTTFALYGDLPDILGFGRGDAVVTLTSSARSSVARGYSIFEAWFRIALRLFEHRRTAHRRRQDCTTATNSADNRTTTGKWWRRASITSSTCPC